MNERNWALPKTLSGRFRRPRICVAGIITESKGQRDAIWALKKLKDDGFPAELILIGRIGYYSKQLIDLPKHLGIEAQVKFTGHVDNPLPIIASCDVVAMCSRWEAFGRVTVEAMKLGKPVVGARSGGTVELIQDGCNGFLYTVGDYEDLATKLRMLLSNEALKSRMGASARSWASDRFTRANFRDDLIRLLTVVADSQPSNGFVVSGEK